MLCTNITLTLYKKSANYDNDHCCVAWFVFVLCIHLVDWWFWSCYFDQRFLLWL